MRIAVIEDEKAHRDLLLSYLERWSAEQGGKEEIYSFETAESFWFAYEEDKEFDILFVDIQMPGADDRAGGRSGSDSADDRAGGRSGSDSADDRAGGRSGSDSADDKAGGRSGSDGDDRPAGMSRMNGMELAKRVREKDRDVAIVFTTGITDYLEEGYEVEALRYLVKPLNEEKVRLCLEKAGSRRQPDVFVTLHTEEETLKINEESINYAEARGHGCILGMAGSGELAVKESLSELEDLLDGSFVKCHRSYLCRIGNIRHIGKEKIVFDDGQCIPVSRRLYNEVNRRFIEHFRREPWGGAL